MTDVHKQKHCSISITTGYPTKTVSDLIDIPIGFFAISVKSGYHIKTKIKRPVLLVPRLLWESSFILRKTELPRTPFLPRPAEDVWKRSDQYVRFPYPMKVKMLSMKLDGKYKSFNFLILLPEFVVDIGRQKGRKSYPQDDAALQHCVLSLNKSCWC